MADTPLDELPEVVTSADADLLYTVQGGNSRRVTRSKLLASAVRHDIDQDLPAAAKLKARNNIGALGKIAETLTDAEKATVRGNIGALAKGPEALTANEKAQVRSNFSAASLDGDGKVPLSELPDELFGDIETVASQAAMLALSVPKGSIAIRTDVQKNFVLRAEPASVLANWVELAMPTAPVTKVAGKQGEVDLLVADIIGLDEAIEQLIADLAGITYAKLGVIPNAQLPARIRAAALVATDANLLNENGWYRIEPSAANTPAVNDTGLINVIAQSATVLKQIWYQRGGNRVFMRHTISGEAGFTDWFENYTGSIYRNYLINGGFDVWQRGTSFSTSVYTADRWRLGGGVSAVCAISRQTFGSTDILRDFGQSFYLRWTRTSAGTSESTLTNKIENVRTLAGRRTTITFWANTSVATALTPKLEQYFGTDGGASPSVYPNFGKIALTPGWKKYTSTIKVPSVAGKTIGSANYLGFYFGWSNTDPNATIELAMISLVEGDATREDNPFEYLNPQETLALCQRYYETGSFTGYAEHRTLQPNSLCVAVPVVFKVPKRVTPSTLIGYTYQGGGSFIRTGNLERQDPNSATVYLMSGGSSGGVCDISFNWVADSEF